MITFINRTRIKNWKFSFNKFSGFYHGFHWEYEGKDNHRDKFRLIKDGKERVYMLLNIEKTIISNLVETFIRENLGK